MSDYFDGFMRDVDKEDNAMQRHDASEERALLDEEMDDLDRAQDIEDAKSEVVTERKLTLTLAWAAAELINQTDVQPRDWNFTRKPKGLFRREPMIGTGASGWSLLAWRSTKHNPDTTHRLILTPHGQGDQGVYLSFFDEIPRISGADSPDEIRPEDVHPLPLEPLSDEDMLWPQTWKGRVDDNGVLVNDEVDGRLRVIEQNDKIMARYARGEEAALSLLTLPRLAAEYQNYAKKGTEKEIRRALAATVALHLRVTPRRAAATIKRRQELGIE